MRCCPTGAPQRTRSPKRDPCTSAVLAVRRPPLGRGARTIPTGRAGWRACSSATGEVGQQFRRPRLAGPIRNRVGSEPEHRDAGGSALEPGNRPPRTTAVPGVCLGGRDHHRGHDLVGRDPVGRELVGPLLPRKCSSVATSASPTGVVVTADREPAVIPPELLEERVTEARRSTWLTTRPSAVTSLSLALHAEREHVPRVGIGNEQRRVEEERNLVAVLGDQVPARLEPGGVDGGHIDYPAAPEGEAVHPACASIMGRRAPRRSRTWRRRGRRRRRACLPARPACSTSSRWSTTRS